MLQHCISYFKLKKDAMIDLRSDTITRPTPDMRKAMAESEAHIFYYEAGAPALLSGVQLRPIAGERGVITAEKIAAAIRGEDIHFPPTRLICLENTHNRAGGPIFPIEE